MNYTIENYKTNIDIFDTFNIQTTRLGKSLLRSESINKRDNNEHYGKLRPLAAACIGLNNTTIPLEEGIEFPHFWNDIDVQEHYLRSTPSNYIIFGKPGTGVYELGEAMSQKYSCIHICPYKIIIDELQYKSPTGKSIDFNIRHNRFMSYNYILDLMKIKLRSPSVAHRGYVLTGLPLISSNKKSKEYLRGLCSEAAVMMAEELIDDLTSVLKKKPNNELRSSVSSVSSEGIPEEAQVEEIEEAQEIGEERLVTSDNIPMLVDFEPSCDVIITKKAEFVIKKAAILNQTTQLFDLPINPDFIIYITCSDEDAVTKRSHKRINYKTGFFSLIQFEKISQPCDLRWPSKYSMYDYVPQTIYDTEGTLDHSEKYQCLRPINFRKNILPQLCNYKSYFLPYIENKIQDFNPNNIIKLDGRTSTDFMIHTIQEKLLLMPLTPVLIPCLLNNMNEDGNDTDNIIGMDDFWINVQKTFSVSSGKIKFDLSPSLWYQRCPVELKYGRSVTGQTKYAVTLFNNVYLLSTLQSQIDFRKNPRSFLKLEYLKPTCRIMVLGTKLSGKTMLSECFSWLLDGKTIDYKAFYKTEFQKKKDLLFNSVLSELIPTIEDARLKEWISKEEQRLVELEQWLNETYDDVKKFAPSLAAEEKHSDSGDSEDEHKFSFLNDYNECQQILKDKQLLIVYAPENLRNTIDKPLTPVIGDEDVSNAIVNYIEENNLHSEIDPTAEEIVLELSKIITDLDKRVQLETNNEIKYAKWIIDDFPVSADYWEELINLKLIPDYIICIVENREIDPEMLTKYKIIEVSEKVHSERFQLVNDPLVTTKSIESPLKPFEFDITLSITLILNNLIYNVVNNSVEDDTIKEEVNLYNESLDKFRESWDSLKNLLDNHQKSYIHVEIEDKSDIQIIEEILCKLRAGYSIKCNENVEEPDDVDEEEEDYFGNTNSSNSLLGDTGLYCPIEFYHYGVLWKGKSEYSTKYNNKIIFFATEENMNKFKGDPTMEQYICRPFKKIPPLRICITGCIGSGRSIVSKHIAKEFSLIHVDISLFINNILIPHCPKVGRQFENIFLDKPFDDETVTEFQTDDTADGEQDHKFDELSGDSIRKIIFDYFEKGSSLPTSLLSKILKILWHEEPFLSTGFVLDGFPRLSSDVGEMVASHSIPDMILELEADQETIMERMSPKMFNTWKEQMKEAKILSNQKYEIVRETWQKLITKEAVIRLIYREIEDNVFKNFTEPEKQASEQSLFTDAHPSGLLNVDNNLFDVYNEVIQAFPEPVNEDEWEKSDDAQERIDGRLEILYSVESEALESMKELIGEQNIPITTVDANFSLKNVIKESLIKVCALWKRGDSFFEQTFVIPLNVAELLLTRGYYFQSKFYRQCPVFIYENPHTTLNLFKANRSNNTIFAVIHRCYIYFLGNERGMILFRNDPLKYITCANIESFASFPLRLGVIGAPKSGKSSLVSRFENYYKLIPISRGLAIRHVLENMWWTELAQKFRKLLLLGKILPPDLIVRAVQTVAMDHRSMTQGFVLDGFPSTIVEAMLLKKIGLYPFVILDLMSDGAIIKNHAEKEMFFNLKRLPAYSIPFTEHVFSRWEKNRNQIRNFIEEDYQNIYEIPSAVTRWQCWDKAQIIINAILPKMHTYLTNVATKAVSLECMCISNNDFEKRCSCFRNFCPVCLRKNVLRHSNFPVERQGLIQYKGLFYWSCHEHKNVIMENPKKYLIDNNAVIPKDIPARVKYYDLLKLYENGVCIVTYAENLPAQKFIQGDPNLAINYMGNVYLCCSSKCLKKFMETPQNFYDITIMKDVNLLPQINLKDLPDIGYLEQTLGNILTEACCHLNVIRPKYPGLSVDISGLLHIALFLKINNPLMKRCVLSLYYKANEIFEARSKLAIRTGLLLRSRHNPFSEMYPKCCLAVKEIDSGTVLKPSSFTYLPCAFEEDERTSRVPVPDERYDYLCEFHKPASKVPAFLNVVDIAGLVKGAAEGQGLGNAFLSHIKACDAIFNLCRAFDDEDVIHVDGEVNPVRDLETIAEELRLKDEEQLMQNLDKLERTVGRGGDKKLKPEHDALLRIKTVLVDEKKHIRFGDWSMADIEVLNKYLFLTSKPALYLVNLSEKDYTRKKNKWLPKLKEWIDKNDPGAPLIPFSGALETKLLDMDPEQAKAYLKENNVTSALDKIIVQGYRALQLEYFFTAGADEVKAWTIQKGTKAPQAAGRIHTDFEKGFIMAEVMHFKDFKEEGTEAACKAAGKYRQQGRNYTVEDGDIIFFKFNAGAGLKDAKKK